MGGGMRATEMVTNAPAVFRSLYIGGIPDATPFCILFCPNHALDPNTSNSSSYIGSIMSYRGGYNATAHATNIGICFTSGSYMNAIQPAHVIGNTNIDMLHWIGEKRIIYKGTEYLGFACVATNSSWVYWTGLILGDYIPFIVNLSDVTIL